MTLKLLAVLNLLVLATADGWDTDSSVSGQEGTSCQIKTGEEGICTRLSGCAVYYEGLRQKTIKYSFLVRCSFVDTEEVICCPQATTQPVLQLVTTTQRPTMRPLVAGGKPLADDQDFYDLTKILRKATKTPRQNQFDPTQQNNSGQPISSGAQRPGRPGNGNKVRWPSQEVNTPVASQNNVQFPTVAPSWRPQQTVTVDPDVEVFNSIDSNKGSSAQMVQLPPQTRPTPPRPTANVVEHDDIFEAFKFRPGTDESIVNEKNAVGWSWSSPNTQRTVSTTTAHTTPRTVVPSSIVRTTSTTPIPEIPFTTTPTPSRPIDTITPRTETERPSQAACRRYTGFDPAGLTFHIIGGTPVDPGEFPHMGGLIYPLGGGTDVDNRCGSSLISERYVLTAAHCVNDPLSLPTLVRLGVVVWNASEDDSPPVDVEIEKITLHPEYLSHLRYHDVALIRLRRDVEFSVFVRPACLYSDTKDIDTSTNLVVIGWGVTNIQTRSRSTVLLKANVTTVPLQECNATHIAYGTSRSYRTGLNDGHYCAFDPELKKDACQADSGGPLQWVRNKESTIVGIVSFGLSCGSSVPSVYARVAHYLDWIEGIVWPS